MVIVGQNKIILSLVFLLVFIASEVFAQGSWRCGSRLVSVGMATGQVMATCGQPDYSRQSSTQTSGSGIIVRSGRGAYYMENQITTQAIEEWFYNPGSGREMVILVFVGGRLEKILYAGFGSGPRRYE